MGGQEVMAIMRMIHYDNYNDDVNSPSHGFLCRERDQEIGPRQSPEVPFQSTSNFCLNYLLMTRPNSKYVEFFPELFLDALASLDFTLVSESVSQ